MNQNAEHSGDMIRQAILEFLHTRGAAPGETVEFSWFVLQVTEGAGGIDVETLDFKQMASFTRDLSVVEHIHQQQMDALGKVGVEAEPCNLRQFANVDPAYEPGDPDTFMFRASPADGNDSGWFVALRQDGLRLNNVRSHDAVSLYELSLHDPRLTPYWLLPTGYSVVWQNGSPLVIRAGESGQYFEMHTARRPWWKFW